MKAITKRERMFALVVEWEKSGLSQREFARQRGVDNRRLHYWIQVKRGSLPSEGGFIAIAPSSSSAFTDQIEVVFPNGVTVKGVFNLDTLRQLLSLY